jgi:hypothetical protein
VLIFGARLLPKRYAVGERLTEAAVFWHNGEAFIFLDVNPTGKATNAVQDELQGRRYGFLTNMIWPYEGFNSWRVRAYRLLASGQLIAEPLPPNTAIYGHWGLVSGGLQLTPRQSGRVRDVGIRWDGTRFVALPASALGLRQHSKTPSQAVLAPDDVNDEAEDSGLVTADARAQFTAASWHYKQLDGYEGRADEAILPIDLGTGSFGLTLVGFPRDVSPYRFDGLSLGIKKIAVGRADGSQPTGVLWSQSGWHGVSKQEFEQMALASDRVSGVPSMLMFLWIAVFLAAVFWKFGAWAHLFWTLFGTKRRVLKVLANSYSFPSASIAQFPRLNVPELERYTRELENLGFTRLLDFSLVPDAPNPIPNFCRLLANKRHHCFGEIHQFFPRGKSPLAVRCAMHCSLDDGWSLTFTDRKPGAVESLVRRQKALSVSMPQASLADLLNSFLQMRSQVCGDIGISPQTDDSFEAYAAKLQRSAQERREAVKRRNFATGLSQVYFRKLSLLKTQPEYAWLGAYPQEAERRKQGFQVEARAL